MHTSYNRTHLTIPRLSLKLVVEHKIWDRASQIFDRENKNETSGMTKDKNMARLRSSPRSSAPDATVSKQQQPERRFIVLWGDLYRLAYYCHS